MIPLLRRTAGLVAILAGGVGVLLSAYAIVQTSATAAQLRRQIPATIDQLSRISNVVHRQAGATVETLQFARDRVASVRSTIEDFANQDDAGTNTERLSEALRSELAQRLGTAEEFVVSMQGSLRSIGGTLLVLDSLPFLAPPPPAGAAGMQSQLRSVAETLSETADVLDGVARDLAEIRAGRSIGPQQLEHFRGALRRIDEELVGVQSEVRSFGRQIENVTVTMDESKRSVAPQIDRTSTAVTVLLVCFACSQVSLGLHGWSLLRQPRTVDAGSEPGTT